MIKTLIALLREKNAENEDLRAQLRNEKERSLKWYTQFQRINTSFNQLKNQVLCETCQGRDCKDGKTIELCSDCSKTLTVLET